MQVEDAETTRFLKHTHPFFGREFYLRRNQPKRIGAIDAMQGTAMGNFGNQGQWVWNH
jgi:hypothetical protein